MPDNKYIPGVCNIGQHEIEKRQRYAIAYSFVAVLFPYISYYVGFPLTLKLLVFLPAAVAIANILQIYYKFCIYFGLSALLNFGNSETTKQTVTSEQDRQLDSKKAHKLLLVTLALALVYTIIIAVFF